MTVDSRPFCDDLSEDDIMRKENSILCLNPYQNECEVYQKKSRHCFDDEKTLCIGWIEILIGILIANICQVIFETAMAYSIELTYKPTYLDRMQDTENFEED